MNKLLIFLKNKYVIMGLVALGLCGGSFYAGYQFNNKKIQKPEPGEIISNHVDRSSNITLAQAVEALKHYDNDQFKIDYRVKKQTSKILEIETSVELYQRHATQEVKFPISTYRNYGISLNYYMLYVNNKLIQAGGADFIYRWERFSINPGIIAGKDIFGAKIGATLYL